jgi:nucleoside-diphosphate-sugar epimerase
VELIKVNSSTELYPLNIFITGGGGYIGSELIKNLLEHKCNINRLLTKYMPPISGVSDIAFNPLSKEAWEEIVDKANIIYLLAGNTSVYDVAANPVNNLIKALSPISHIIEACKKLDKCPRVVFASTATVYGLTQNIRIDEKVAPAPITSYDLHKYFVEQELLMASNKGIIEGISLRLSNVYGPSSGTSSSSDRGIISKVINLAISGEKVRLFGAGDYYRDFIYIKDVVTAFRLAGFTVGLESGAYNIVFGSSHKLADVFKSIIDKLMIYADIGVDLVAEPWPINFDPIEKRSFFADNNKFKRATNWDSTVNLDSGLDELIRYLI